MQDQEKQRAAQLQHTRAWAEAQVRLCTQHSNNISGACIRCSARELTSALHQSCASTRALQVAVYPPGIGFAQMLSVYEFLQPRCLLGGIVKCATTGCGTPG